MHPIILHRRSPDEESAVLVRSQRDQKETEPCLYRKWQVWVQKWRSLLLYPRSIIIHRMIDMKIHSQMR